MFNKKNTNKLFSIDDKVTTEVDNVDNNNSNAVANESSKFIAERLEMFVKKKNINSSTLQKSI